MYDLIIIGMGPAGMSAGIYAKRSGVNVLMLDGELPGGLLNKISIVDNYLGFSDVTGPELSESMYMHIKNVGVSFKLERVVNVIKTDDGFDVFTNKNVYKTKAIIVGVGRKQKKIGIVNEDKYFGKGVSYCAICDGPLYKGKKLAVVGGGNSAFEESLYLSKFSDDITILVRGGISADAFLVDKVKEANIKIIENVSIDSFYGDDVFRGIKYNDNVEDFDGVFIYVGYEADITFLKGFDIFDENGYIVANEKMKSKVDGIYACGDIIKKDLYQIATAVGDGAIAGINASKYVKKVK